MDLSVQEEYRMLSRLAGDKIRGYIAENGLKTGDRLPTERDLAERLEVSRPVIREALGTLEALGLIVKRQGKGIFLSDPNFSILFQEMMEVWQRNEANLEQMMQLRRMLEEAAVNSIIEHADETDYDKLDALIDIAERDSASVVEFVKLDYQFHRDLLALSRNSLFTQLTDVVNRYFHEVETRWIRDRGLPGKQKTIREHRELVRLFREKDRAGAARLLRIHLTGSEAHR